MIEIQIEPSLTTGRFRAMLLKLARNPQAELAHGRREEASVETCRHLELDIQKTEPAVPVVSALARHHPLDAA